MGGDPCQRRQLGPRESIHRASRQESVDQFGEPVGQGRTKASEIGGIPVEPRQRRIGIGLTEKGDSTGEAFVQHETERVEVGATVELLAAHLLGREVLRSSHHHVRAGEIVAGRTEPLGDAEVGQQHSAVGCDQDVARLHIAMHETGTVRGVEGGRNTSRCGW